MTPLEIDYIPITIFGDLNLKSPYNKSLRGLVRALQTLGRSPRDTRVIPALSRVDLSDDPDSAKDWLLAFVNGDSWAGGSEIINIVHLPAAEAGGFCCRAAKTRYFNILYADDAPVGASSFDELWVPAVPVPQGAFLMPFAMPKTVRAVAEALRMRLEHAAEALRLK